MLKQRAYAVTIAITATMVATDKDVMETCNEINVTLRGLREEATQGESEEAAKALKAIEAVMSGHKEATPENFDVVGPAFLKHALRGQFRKTRQIDLDSPSIKGLEAIIKITPKGSALSTEGEQE